MLQNLALFEIESLFFAENFITKNNYFKDLDHTCLLYLTDFADYNFLKIYYNDNLYIKSLTTFINQIEDLAVFNNLENVASVYHYSIPTVKLAYPEPFIASASFMHNDLWFVHILIYQYWLWFVFVFIIVFFFIGFITTVRWCNMRVKPRRETRGVSRSKCGDLVTAIVPVSWAASIIINESTDAIDYYDGFGTTELVIGIRAYQWGWEYYYPKDLDLNYNVKHSYSSFIGNSLKYSSTTSSNLKLNNPWKFYQNKSTDAVVTPAYLLVLPLDNYKMLNFLNFNDIGINPLSESNAFKKIKTISKTFTSTLFYTHTDYTNKYHNIFANYLNNNSYSNSYLYGTKRQHNFLSIKALSSNSRTFFNLNNINKLLNFNLQNDFNNNEKTYNNFNFFSYFVNFSKNNLNNNLIRFNNFFKETSPVFWNKLTSYSSLIEIINNDTDRKKIKQPLLKLFNFEYSKYNLSNLKTISNSIFLTDLTSNINNNVLFFNNNQITNKSFSLFSSNQTIPFTERSLRKFANSSFNTPLLNNTVFINPVNNAINIYNKLINDNNFFLTNLNSIKWPETTFLNKITSNKNYFNSPYAAIVSNNSFNIVLNYDNCSNVFTENVPIVLQGKEELLPNFVTTAYWNLFFSDSYLNWRLLNNLNYNSKQNAFYLPFFNFYYDYDFRNWQSLELLEDSYWESSHSNYSFDDYFSISNDYFKSEYFDKFDQFYNYRNRILKFNKNKSLYSFFKNNDHMNKYYTNSIFIEDFISPTSLLNTSNFFIFPLNNIINNFDDSYESIKHLNYFYNNFFKLFFNTNTNYFPSYSYLFIFDSFRSDYDNFSWFLDKSKNYKNDIYTFLNNKNYINIFNENELLLNFNLFNDNSIRFNNYLNLRNTIRSSIVTYNAIQKVLRSRFDEGRSNARLIDFSNSYIKHSFITTNRIKYERLLGKNKNNFFKTNLYKNNFLNFTSNLYDNNSSLNFFIFDFPFLVALKSDATRYLWFDWYSKWGFYEVQPSSSSRYAIYGMPYFNKSFDFASYASDSISETENYLLRLSRARKNYLPNWVYTPYFYAKNMSWYRNNIIFEIFNQTSNSITSVNFLLNSMTWYWKSLYFINFHNFLFFPSNSNVNSFSKMSWQPSFSIQSYYYNVSTLVDTLTKREYLYRSFFSNNNKLINLPFYFTNNPNNPLINEIKSSFLLIDPISYNNEYSRDIFYSSLAFFNFNVIKSLYKETTNIFGLNNISNYLLFYFFNENLYKNLGKNQELFKYTHRPMRKGITNMIRLHATNAVAMPIEIRLQILASSKDIIHSWAIPSAGIKIDCIPGYSSHRVMIFLVSGIFWGQCMEICGRYHHWMPIIVYFMKRDLFFLWCTHFVFLSGSNNMWNINDRQYSNYSKTVSFDKTSWISELNK